MISLRSKPTSAPRDWYTRVSRTGVYQLHSTMPFGQTLASPGWKVPIGDRDMLIKFGCTILTGLALTISAAAGGVVYPANGCGDGVLVCQDAGVSGAGGQNHGHGQGPGVGQGHCGAGIGLTPDETVSVLFMREEEKVARDSYIEMGELWSLAIFENISASEQKHMDAMKRLIDCYGLTDPVIDGIGEFYDTALQKLFDDLMLIGQKSMMDGLYVGALIEETDMRDIQVAIDVSFHPDIVSTYESLLCGSRNHLRAFIGQIEINGGSYTPSVLDPDEFWLIAHSEMEQDCGSF